MRSRTKRRALTASVLTAVLTVIAGLAGPTGPAMAQGQPAGAQSQAAPAPPVDETGCRTASADLPWGEYPVRSWTPLEEGRFAPHRGVPFDARLVTAYNHDAEASSEMVVLEDADGCRTAFRSSEFTDADRTHISDAIAENPPAEDPDDYRTAFDDGLVSAQQVADGVTSLYETQHFAVFFGHDTSAFSYRYMADRGTRWQDAIETLGGWMEKSWTLIRDNTGARMPWQDSDDKQKVNIYICGTGLPWTEDTGDCGASASGNGIWVSAVYILDGSSTMTHEFGHTMQGLTGGFQGDLPGVGNIWEAHANWLAAATGPDFNVWYYQNLENGPTWQTNYYGFFPLLFHLQGDPRTADYPWRAWRENLRDESGQSTEEFLETVVRLGRDDGIYPDGFASFADDLGWYGARLAANDFVQGPEFLGQTRIHQEASRYVGLVPSDTRDTYASPPERPLWQFGSHLIPLRIDGARTSVTLTGGTTEAAAAWRYALVRVAEDGRIGYSSLGRADADQAGTTVALDTSEPGEYFLAVTATPDGFERIGGETDPAGATDFPYAISLTGARPALPGTGVCLGPYPTADAANLNWHTNGKATWDTECSDVGPLVTITAEPKDDAGAGSPAKFSAAATGAATVRRQWQVLTPGSGVWKNLGGATGTSVTLPVGTASGSLVRMKVTGKNDTVIVTRSAVHTARKLQTATPTIEGTARVGTVLAAVGGAWGPQPVSLTYRWFVGGVVVAGANQPTWTVSSSAVGKTITVQATGKKTGYASSTRTSAATAAVAPGALTTAAPRITGTARAGQTLTATPGSWGPDGVALTYQWKADGAVIEGATGTTYRLTSGHVGKKITVTVKGAKPGYTSRWRTSTATSAVVR